uniref:Uncharacterized protein n=1 Tax=viral metagenome TaxID=1070528 RepID=A0A6M3LC19_9ZZZZ
MTDVDGDLVICTRCNDFTRLISIRTGEFLDEAWGRPRWFPVYELRTHCCKGEDWERIGDE